MTSRKIVLTLDSDFFQRLKKKANRQGYKDIHHYVEEVLRRQVYWTRSGSRKKDADNEYLDKFSKPTKATYKILRSIQPR